MELKIGTSVTDVKYGKGQVVSIKDKALNKYNVVILFEKKNIKVNFNELGFRQGLNTPITIN